MSNPNTVKEQKDRASAQYLAMGGLMLLILDQYGFIITGSIAHSASRRYLVYSEADLEVFRPARATRCTDGGEIWHGPLLHAKFHLQRCKDRGVGPQKLKFLLRFDQNVEYKCLAGAYPLCDFHKICRVCTTFQDALAVKIWLNLLEGLWSYGCFKLRGSGFPKFSMPPSGETKRQTPKSFRGARTCSRSCILYHHAKFGGARISPATGVAKNV